MFEKENSEGIVVRPMTDRDDKSQIAKLIYWSDDYIYPNWFTTMEEGQRVLAEMMSLPTIYNKKNITVAVTRDGFVAGALVTCDSPFCEEEKYLYEAFAAAGVAADERTHRIYLDYYAKMGEEHGHYFANLAVDPDFRGRGIGTALMSYVLAAHPNAYLECVQSNAGAWRIYQRLGFEIVQEYPGVFDVPCYKMIRKEE